MNRNERLIRQAIRHAEKLRWQVDRLIRNRIWLAENKGVVCEAEAETALLSMLARHAEELETLLPQEGGEGDNEQ
ncbi:MAG: hypothetical protein ACYCQK_01245 [Acidiferrobacteraceae bacterium]